jgi:hypothetical protein
LSLSTSSSLCILCIIVMVLIIGVSFPCVAIFLLGRRRSSPFVALCVLISFSLLYHHRKLIVVIIVSFSCASSSTAHASSTLLLPLVLFRSTWGTFVLLLFPRLVFCIYTHVVRTMLFPFVSAALLLITL